MPQFVFGGEHLLRSYIFNYIALELRLYCTNPSIYKAFYSEQDVTFSVIRLIAVSYGNMGRFVICITAMKTVS